MTRADRTQKVSGFLTDELSSLSREDLQRVIQRLGTESDSVGHRIRYLLRRRDAVPTIALRISTLRRSDPRNSDGLADVLGQQVEKIVTDIEQDVLPEDPVRALALTECLLDLDGRLMEYESDYNPIRDAFEAASLLWLKVARAARDQGCLPLMDWCARLREIYERNDDGVRSALIEQAQRVLEPSEYRRLQEYLVDEAQKKRERWETRRGRLTDSDISLGWYPSPATAPLPEPRTPVVETERAQFQLDCGDIEQALSVLLPLKEGQAFSDREATLDLLDRAYGQLGDTAKRIEVRRERFRAKPDVASYRRLAQLLDEPALEALRQEIALKPILPPDIVTRARMCFAANLPMLAHPLVLSSMKNFEIEGLTRRLAALGLEAAELGYPLAATAVWRGLLNSILKSGKTRDYRLGAALLSELQVLSEEIDDYRDLPTHVDYEAELYDRHRLKNQFWRGVERVSPAR